jgi:PPM family protein phosphatase
VPFFKEIEHFGLTDVGAKRSHNQDAFTVQKAPDREHWQRVGHLFIVADGMGGHAVGEKASAKAVQEIPLTYVKHVHDGPASALRHAFQEANAGINAVGTSNPEFRGLGTTATALVLRDEGAWIAHVGDSRAYRIRGAQIQQLTYDHSYAWEMARRLGIPPEELGEVKKNVIVRSLGPDPLVQVDVEGPYPLEDGDTFVLCSDGLSNQVPPEEVGAVVAALPVEEAARFLVELANLRGGPDNITIVIVRVGTARDSMAAPLPTPWSRLKASANRLVEAWRKHVPWAITVLLAGFLLAVAFVVCAANGWTSGAAINFTLAAICIIAGVIGLYLHSKKEAEAPPPIPETPTRASVYRQYPIRIDANLLDQFTKTTLQLKEQLEARDWQVDWPGYKAQADAAAKTAADGDLLAAFRHHCRALTRLAAPFNQHRPKEEAFRPKWETPSGH